MIFRLTRTPRHVHSLYRGVYYSTPSLVFLSSILIYICITPTISFHCIPLLGGFGKTSNWNSVDIWTPTSTKLTHDIDLSDHYLTMTSLDHAHFRFPFYGRLHFFSFFVNYSLTPEDIYEIPPAPCARRGSPKIARDKVGHLPPAVGPDPPK